MQIRWARLAIIVGGWAFVGTLLSLEVLFNMRASMRADYFDALDVAIPQFGRALMWALLAPLVLKLRTLVPLSRGASGGTGRGLSGQTGRLPDPAYPPLGPFIKERCNFCGDPVLLGHVRDLDSSPSLHRRAGAIRRKMRGIGRRGVFKSSDGCSFRPCS